MPVVIGFVCLVGWIVGAWVPWWIVAAMWCGFGINLCLSKQSGLDNAIEGFVWGILLVITSLSGFIFGDVTFVDIWEFIKMVVSGGKY